MLTGKAYGNMSRNARSECWVSCRSPAEGAAIFYNPEPKRFLPSLFLLFPIIPILTEPMRFLRQIPYRNLSGNQHEICVQNALLLNVTNGGSAC